LGEEESMNTYSLETNNDCASTDIEPESVPEITIRRADDSASITAARALIRAHIETASALHDCAVVDNIVSALPAPYRGPRAALWVAWSGNEPLGCAALHALSETIAELKRMYVRPEARGFGVGRRLTQHAIAAARSMGYKRVRLGTLSTATAAQQLYSSLGFRLIAPYRPVEFGKTWFYELAIG
jgi:GNAT superfamily N-acetyltransferase